MTTPLVSDELDLNKVKAVYLTAEDLKIAALKKDDEDGGLKKKGLLSFIANTFVVKKDGPTPAKAYETRYERDPYRSFFNTVWQPISMGIVKSVKGK